MPRLLPLVLLVALSVPLLAGCEENALTAPSETANVVPCGNVDVDVTGIHPVVNWDDGGIAPREVRRRVQGTIAWHSAGNQTPGFVDSQVVTGGTTVLDYEVVDCGGDTILGTPSW